MTDERWGVWVYRTLENERTPAGTGWMLKFYSCFWGRKTGEDVSSEARWQGTQVEARAEVDALTRLSPCFTYETRTFDK